MIFLGLLHQNKWENAQGEGKSHKGGIKPKFMVCEIVRCLYVPRDHIINNPLRGIPGFSPLPRHLPIYFDVIIPKISKKVKKVNILSLPKSLLCYSIAVYNNIWQLIFNLQRNALILILWTFSPIRIIQHTRKFDFNLLNYQNWPIGSENMDFSTFS